MVCTCNMVGINIQVCVCICVCVGKAISGPQLASLLEILVTAANEGSLAEVKVTTS